LWHGKITENAVSGSSADYQRTSIVDLSDAGFEIVMHSHDEIVTEVDEDRAAELHAKQREIMIAPRDWAPGIPLDAKGWIGAEYRKD
jgi:DNA polymerase